MDYLGAEDLYDCMVDIPGMSGKLKPNGICNIEYICLSCQNVYTWESSALAVPSKIHCGGCGKHNGMEPIKWRSRKN